MFGDKKYFADSATQPHKKLHKLHDVLSFHRVREAISYKIVSFYRVYGGYNPADFLSKNIHQYMGNFVATAILDSIYHRLYWFGVKRDGGQ